MDAVTVYDKGQITLPAHVRKQLGIKPKSRMEVELKGNQIILTPERSILDFYGIFHEAAKGKTDDYETIRQKTMAAVAEEVVNEDKR